jgi:hypothetical protein
MPNELTRAVLRVGVATAFNAMLTMRPSPNLQLGYFLPDIVKSGQAKDVSEGLSFDHGLFGSDCYTVMMFALMRGDLAIYRRATEWYGGRFQIHEILEMFVEGELNVAEPKVTYVARMLDRAVQNTVDLEDKLRASERENESFREQLNRLQADARELGDGLADIAQTQFDQGGVSNAVATVTLPAKRKAEGCETDYLRELVDAVLFHPGANEQKRCKDSFDANAGTR